MLQAIQRGVERALLNLQAAVGDLLNAQQDAVAVQQPERDGLEYQEVEGALQQLGRVAHAALLDMPGEDARLLLGRQGERGRLHAPAAIAKAATEANGICFVSAPGRQRPSDLLWTPHAVRGAPDEFSPLHVIVGLLVRQGW